MYSDEDKEYEVVQKYDFPDSDCCIIYDTEEQQHVILKPKESDGRS